MNTGAGFYIVRLKLTIPPSVNLRKLKSLSGIIEILSGIFSGHNTMRLDTNYREKKAVKNTNTWRLNNTFLNKEKFTKEIKREIKKIPRNNWQWKYHSPKPTGCSGLKVAIPWLSSGLPSWQNWSKTWGAQLWLSAEVRALFHPPSIYSHASWSHVQAVGNSSHTGKDIEVQVLSSLLFQNPKLRNIYKQHHLT